MQEQENTKSIRVKSVVIAGLIIAFVLVAGLTAFTYLFPQNGASVRIRSIVPQPAILVNGTHMIMFHDVDTDMASIRRFYESQSDELSKAGVRVDFSTEDGQKRLMVREKELLNKMVEDKAIQILAQDRHITITQDAVSSAVDQKISALGNNRDDVSAKLKRLYGWDMDDFENKIVAPEMYRDALAAVYAKDIDTSSYAKNRALAAQNDLKQKKSFADVAKEYSQGNTAADGGELGWVPISSLAPELTSTVKKQAINQVSDIIESSLGFHIIAIEERKQEQGQEMVRMKQIFTRKVTFSDWLTQQMKRMNVTVLFKGYMWDKDTARIEFKQPEMRSFEENILQTSQGDASVLF